MKPIVRKHGVHVYNHTFSSRQVSLLRKLEAQLPYAYISLRETFGKEHVFLLFILRTGQQILAKGSGNTTKEETGCGKFGTGLFKRY